MQFTSRMLIAQNQAQMHRYEGRITFQAKGRDLRSLRIAIAGETFWPFFQADRDLARCLSFPIAANDGG